jgi:hypothetical protein
MNTIKAPVINKEMEDGIQSTTLHSPFQIFGSAAQVQPSISITSIVDFPTQFPLVKMP